MKLIKNTKIRLGLPVDEKDREKILKHKFNEAKKIIGGVIVIFLLGSGIYFTIIKPVINLIIR